MSTTTTKPFKLYHFYVCPYCKPIYYFVNKTQIPHEAIHLDLLKGENRTPEYLAINPFGRVPAIVEEDGFVLFESSTVLKYLCNTRDVPDHWYPKDPRKRSQVDLFFDWYQVATKAFSAYFYSKNPELPNRVPVVEDPQELLEKTLGELEKTFLRDRKFLTSDEISLADIQIIFFFGNLDRVKYELTKFPGLQGWKDRVLATDIKPEYEKYLVESSKAFEDMKKAFANKAESK